MSNILNSIKSVIASSIKVEVKPPVTKSNKTRFPILVTDVGHSFTSGWFVQYNPVAQDNGTRLYDGSETFSELHIARFSELHNLILTANYYFIQGVQVEQLAENRKRAIYEPTPALRLTVTSQQNSVSVVATITDESSPFHMMSIKFTVTPSNSGDGSYYVVGTDNERWDRNTDTFKEYNASFAPRKGRFYRVHQQQNQPATLRAKLAVSNGQYAINHDGTFAIDTNAAAPEYIQVITNEFKALAYIYEQALMSKAFELALAQGLPVAQYSNPGAPAQPQQQPSNFVPAFSLNGIGNPNPTPVNGMVPPAQPQQQAPAPQQQPAPVGNPTPQGNLPAGISPDDLPWGMN